MSGLKGCHFSRTSETRSRENSDGDRGFGFTVKAFAFGSPSARTDHRSNLSRQLRANHVAIPCKYTLKP